MKLFEAHNSKDLLIISIVTLITVFAWIGFQTYSTRSKETISAKTKVLITPLNPIIQEDVLSKLEQAQP